MREKHQVFCITPFYKRFSLSRKDTTIKPILQRLHYLFNLISFINSSNTRVSSTYKENKAD